MGEWMMKKVLALLLALAMLIPAACAVTKDDIKAELGVFRVDALQCTTNIELLPDKDCPRFVLTMEDDIILGGSELSSDEWFTDGGVMCEADVDMDGDGRKEYVIVYSRMSDDEWPQPELLLRIYACDGEDFTLKGELPLFWYYENSSNFSCVRIVPQKNGAAILSCGIWAADGASYGANVLLYRYDGENCTIPLYAYAINYGDYLAINDVRHPELLSHYTSLDSWDLEYETLDEDYEYNRDDASDENPDSTFAGPLSTDGFERMNDHLAKYGIEIEFSKHIVDEDWGYVSVDGIDGGKDFQTTSSNERLQTLTLGLSGPLADVQTEGLNLWAPELSDDPYHEIIPDSAARKLTKAELAGCDAELLGYIRNEILARHGYSFTKEKYQEYFGSKYWYEINEEFSFSDLSDVENANVELIKSLE